MFKLLFKGSSLAMSKKSYKSAVLVDFYSHVLKFVGKNNAGHPVHCGFCWPFVLIQKAPPKKAWSPSGQWLASASRDQLVMLMETELMDTEICFGKMMWY